MHSSAFEFKVRNRDIYEVVGGNSSTNADFIMFFRYVNRYDYIVYVPYGPEIEPSWYRNSITIPYTSNVTQFWIGCSNVVYM